MEATPSIISPSPGIVCPAWTTTRSPTRKAAEETSGGLSLPAPPPSAFGVSDATDTEWVKRRLTPHPFGTYTSPLNIKGPVGNNLPRRIFGRRVERMTAPENLYS